MGYSGAVRVGGLVAAHLQHHGPAEDELIAARPHWLSVASELEDHADNAAASIFGGVVAAAAGRAVRIPMPFDPTAVLWAPASTTSTSVTGHAADDVAVRGCGLQRRSDGVARRRSRRR